MKFQYTQIGTLILLSTVNLFRVCPLLDRIDIHIEVPPLKYDEMNSNEEYESSEKIRERVIQARKFSMVRHREESGKNPNMVCNGRLSPKQIKKFCKMEADADKILHTAFERLKFSARGYDRILKIARTIADLEFSDTIKKHHITEAIQYRSLDKNYWQ